MNPLAKIERKLFIFGIAALALSSVAKESFAQPACTPTRPDSEGPFYEPNAPKRDETGQGLVVSGTVRSASGCATIAGAKIEWWSASPDGSYDEAHRATQRADREGSYRYETDFPGNYGRPFHLHVRVTAPGHRTLTTQLYPEERQRQLKFDFVLIPN